MFTTENRTLRGNTGENMRRSTIGTASAGRPVRTNISRAAQIRSTGAQLSSPVLARTSSAAAWVPSTRVVVPARSMCMPSSKKRAASSRAIVSTATPTTACAALFTNV